MGGADLPAGGSLNLVVRRAIPATAERLFEAWTRPDLLRRWWGPAQVSCVAAEIDLRVGGRYRIGNRMANGELLWIAGEFKEIVRPHKLVYTWRLEPEQPAAVEQVTVRFEPRGSLTEVTVVHERIGSPQLYDSHQSGWEGCLDGLDKFLSQTPPAVSP